MNIASLRIGNKLLLAFVLLIVAFSAVLYFATINLEQHRERTNNFQNRIERVTTASNLELNTTRVQYTLMRYLLADNGSITAYRRDLNHYLQNSQRYRLELEENSGAYTQEVVNRVIQIHTQYVDLIENGVIPAIDNQQDDQARALLLSQGSEVLINLYTTLELLDEEVSRRTEEDIHAMDAALSQMTSQILVFGLVIVVVALLMSYLLSRHIARPLASLTIYAEHISRGEIPKELPEYQRDDEVGRLGNAFAAMSEYLRDMVQDLNEGINVLATSSEEIMAVTAQVASSTQETATAISEIATTVEEVKQTAAVAGKKSQAVLESSELTREEAEQGQESVQATLEGMENIRQQMQSVAESIMRLGEQSQAIGEIVASVSDLAEQSNLLGVNASIEAAKAGEAGKGFAVVAQEIKGLADQSKQATGQVRNILGEIQRALNKAVLLAEQSSKTVDSGYQKASQSGDVIQTLATRIADSSDMATQIAASSQQQEIGMDQISQAMENIRQASQDNVSGAHQVDQAARSLNDLGVKLKNLASRFKL